MGNVFLTAQARFMGFFLSGLGFQIGYKGFFWVTYTLGFKLFGLFPRLCKLSFRMLKFFHRLLTFS
jgi:hypothetical protein